MTEEKYLYDENGKLIITKEIKEAYKKLLTQSWEIVKKRTHKDDIPSRERNYKQVLNNFEKDPSGYIEDCLEDICSTFDW